VSGIDAVMVRVLASSAENRGFPPRWRKTKIQDIIIICCLPATYAALRSKTVWHMCLRGASCLTADCCFSELALL